MRNPTTTIEPAERLLELIGELVEETGLLRREMLQLRTQLQRAVRAFGGRADTRNMQDLVTTAIRGVLGR